jgi:hypothetical protein
VRGSGGNAVPVESRSDRRPMGFGDATIQFNIPKRAERAQPIPLGDITNRSVESAKASQTANTTAQRAHLPSESFMDFAVEDPWFVVGVEQGASNNE